MGPAYSVILPTSTLSMLSVHLTFGMRNFDVELEELRSYPWRELDGLLAPVVGIENFRLLLVAAEGGETTEDEWEAKCDTIAGELKPSFPQLNNEGKFTLLRLDNDGQARGV